MGITAKDLRPGDVLIDAFDFKRHLIVVVYPPKDGRNFMLTLTGDGITNLVFDDRINFVTPGQTCEIGILYANMTLLRWER